MNKPVEKHSFDDIDYDDFSYNNLHQAPTATHETGKKKRKNKKRLVHTLNGSETTKEGVERQTQKESLLSGANVDKNISMKSSKNFGEGWWKQNLKAKEPQVECASQVKLDPQVEVGPQVARSEDKSGQTRLKFKDFYSDSEEEELEEKSNGSKLKDMVKTDESSASSSLGASLDEALSGLKIIKDISGKDTNNSGTKESLRDHCSSKRGICSYCKKEDNLLRCSRCQMASYCGRQCQKDDYPKHKIICRKFKDFYSDSGEEPEEKGSGSNMKDMLKTEESSASSSLGAFFDEVLSGLKIIGDASGKDTDNLGKNTNNSGKKKTLRGICSFCKKEDNNLSRCSRCQMASYCGRQCQKDDYPKHKIICRRKEKFGLMESKIPEKLKMTYPRELGRFRVSHLLSDLPDEVDFACGVSGVVLTEITGPYFHLFRYGVSIKDLVGEESFILFYTETDVYLDKQTGKVPKLCPLSLCLKPGNFILLLDTCFHYFLDGTVGIRINDLDDIVFIFND